jgi:hypothetical protein
MLSIALDDMVSPFHFIRLSLSLIMQNFAINDLPSSHRLKFCNKGQWQWN